VSASLQKGTLSGGPSGIGGKDEHDDAFFCIAARVMRDREANVFAIELNKARLFASFGERRGQTSNPCSFRPELQTQAFRRCSMGAGRQ
jgi:hypothetical protein